MSAEQEPSSSSSEQRPIPGPPWDFYGMTREEYYQQLDDADNARNAQGDGNTSPDPDSTPQGPIDDSEGTGQNGTNSQAYSEAYGGDIYTDDPSGPDPDPDDGEAISPDEALARENMRHVQELHNATDEQVQYAIRDVMAQEQADAEVERLTAPIKGKISELEAKIKSLQEKLDPIEKEDKLRERTSKKAQRLGEDILWEQKKINKLKLEEERIQKVIGGAPARERSEDPVRSHISYNKLMGDVRSVSNDITARQMTRDQLEAMANDDPRRLVLEAQVQEWENDSVYMAKNHKEAGDRHVGRLEADKRSKWEAEFPGIESLLEKRQGDIDKLNHPRTSQSEKARISTEMSHWEQNSLEAYRDKLLKGVSEDEKPAVITHFEEWVRKETDKVKNEAVEAIEKQAKMREKTHEKALVLDAQIVGASEADKPGLTAERAKLEGAIQSWNGKTPDEFRTGEIAKITAQYNRRRLIAGIA